MKRVRFTVKCKLPRKEYVFLLSDIFHLTLPLFTTIPRLHDHLGDNRKSHSCDLVLVTGGTVFTDQLDIKLQCRVTLPGGTLLNQWLCNEACLMARIQSVAYDQIRSKSLITDHMTSDFDRERLPSGAFIYSN